MKWLEVRGAYGSGDLLARIELDAPEDACRIVQAANERIRAHLEGGLAGPAGDPDNPVLPEDGEMFFTAVQIEFGYGSMRAGEVEGEFE